MLPYNTTGVYQLQQHYYAQIAFSQFCADNKSSNSSFLLRIIVFINVPITPQYLQALRTLVLEEHRAQEKFRT